MEKYLGTIFSEHFSNKTYIYNSIKREKLSIKTKFHINKEILLLLSRLYKCGILSLEMRRLRWDVLLVFKSQRILKKLRQVSSSNFWKIYVQEVITCESLNKPTG